MENIFVGNKSGRKDNERMVLDLNQHPSYDPESPHQHSSTGELDLINRLQSQHTYPPQIASSSRVTDNLNTIEPTYVPKTRRRRNKQEEIPGGASNLVDMPSMRMRGRRAEGDMSELVHMQSMAMSGSQQAKDNRAEAKKIRDELKQFRSTRVLPSGDTQQGPNQESTTFDPQQSLHGNFPSKHIRKSDMYHFKQYIKKDSSGANTSSERPPSAMHVIDQSAIPDGYQRRETVNKNDARRKRIPDSHDQFGQQSPRLENNSQVNRQHLIDNNMSHSDYSQHNYQSQDPYGNPDPRYH